MAMGSGAHLRLLPSSLSLRADKVYAYVHWVC